MGNVLGALIEAGYDVQGTVDSAIKAGSFSPTMQLITGPGSSGRIAILGDRDPSLMRALFCVSPAHGRSESVKPGQLPHPSGFSMRLPFLDNVVADTIAVHLELVDEAVGYRGQMNVALNTDTIDTLLIPALARALTSRLGNNNIGGINSTIQSLFDTGGTDDRSGCTLTMSTCSGAQPAGTAACRNPAYGDRPGQCADQCDNIVDTCEVSTNSLVKNLLAPDVQLFASDGTTWAPSPDNRHKDSMSFGFGFTAH
jgi:hypothetical protein